MITPPKMLSQIIEESVQGKHDAWPLDPTYKVEGSNEDRFKAGDNQIVLWEIYGCANSGAPIPEWAARGFVDLFIKVMKCELSWEEAFGKVPADGYGPTIQNLAKNMIPVGESVLEYSRSGRPKDEAMFDYLRNKFKIGRGRLKEYWRRYLRAHRS